MSENGIRIIPKLERWFEFNVVYPCALKRMRECAEKIARSEADEVIWYTTHPNVYTAGVRANPLDLINPNAYPVYYTDRGGEWTFHGVGQLVIYVMVHLVRRNISIHKFLSILQTIGQTVLGDLGLTPIDPPKPGLWIEHNSKIVKVASLGLQVKKGVTFHGLAINNHMNLGDFQGIVPCGLSSDIISDLWSSGIDISLTDLSYKFDYYFNQFLCGESS